MVKKLWMLLAQTVTVGVAAAMIYQVFFAGHVSSAGEPSAAAREPERRAQGTMIPAGSFRGAVSKAAPSVVSVYTARAVTAGPSSPNNSQLGSEQEGDTGMGLGSGVIVSAEGLILTNNHVIEGASEIVVALPGGQPAEARLLGADPETDLAVLKIKASNLRPIVFAAADAARVGDVVLALGNPFGVGETVTQGIVSATGRNRLGINTFENFVQTDAAINPGNSGGALVDVEGNLVGINTAIFSQSGGSQGIGFAIPASLATQVMQQIVATGRVARGWLGVAAADAQVEKDGGGGAVVTGVLRGGPADKAGIRPGDIVTAINGKAVGDTLALVNETAALAPGTRTQVTVVRGRGQNVLTAELGRRPAPQRKGGPSGRP